MAAAATRERDKAVELTALRAKGAGQAQFPALTRRLFVKTITALTAKRLGQVLAKDFRQMFGPAYDETADRLGSFARSVIECLGRSDALYHNMEHTLLVTMAGRDILRGLSLCHRIEPDDYTHLVCACLLHDIGYVRGILSGDTESEFVINQEQVKITLPRGASDAALAPYHVDRSQIFALERLGASPLVDAVRIVKAIEFDSLSGKRRSYCRRRWIGTKIGPSRRFDRTTWRSNASKEGKCALL